MILSRNIKMAPFHKLIRYLVKRKQRVWKVQPVLVYYLQVFVSDDNRYGAKRYKDTKDIEQKALN